MSSIANAMTHPLPLTRLHVLLVDLYRHLGRTITVLDAVRMGIYQLIIYIDRSSSLPD